jgi:hypothetical protein
MLETKVLRLRGVAVQSVVMRKVLKPVIEMIAMNMAMLEISFRNAQQQL